MHSVVNKQELKQVLMNLLIQQDKLQELESAGVDQWEGYEQIHFSGIKQLEEYADRIIKNLEQLASNGAVQAPELNSWNEVQDANSPK